MTDIEKRTPIAATAKKEQGKKKNYYKNKTNQENLDAAMVMLEYINRNYYGEVNRNTKNRMNELLVLLKDKEQKAIFECDMKYRYIYINFSNFNVVFKDGHQQNTNFHREPQKGVDHHPSSFIHL